VLLKLVPELPERQPEQFRGAHLQPARAIEGKPDVAVLDAGKRIFEVDPGGRDLDADRLLVAWRAEVRWQRFRRQ